MSRLPGPNASAEAIRHQLAQPLGLEDGGLQSATVMRLEGEIVRLRAHVTTLEDQAREALARIRDGAPAEAAAALERVLEDAQTST